VNSVNSLFGNTFEMPPPKRKYWNYFERTLEGGTCKLCSKSVISKGGNTTNLAVHLRRSHKLNVRHTHLWHVCKCVISFIFNRNLRYHMMYGISIKLYRSKYRIAHFVCFIFRDMLILIMKYQDPYQLAKESFYW